MNNIYLDNNATTQIADEVVEEMLPYLAEGYGNPSSLHCRGRWAGDAVARAREQVAQLAGCRGEEVCFTSGGTEANNSLLNHLVLSRERPMLAIGATEHPSVSVVAKRAEGQGTVVTTLGVDENGLVDFQQLRQWAAGSSTASVRMVSLMLANNESGVIQPLQEIAEFAINQGILLHTDAVQAAGKIPLDFGGRGFAAMSLSAHKIYGPKGIGAMVMRAGYPLEPLLVGGGQERGQRAGTENVAAIVGFGAAAQLALERLPQESQRLLQLRNKYEQGMRETFPDVVIFAESVERLPNTIFFSLPGFDGVTLVQLLDQQGFSLSAGSACGSDRRAPNGRLQAMGVTPRVAQGAVRLSLGRGNSHEELPPFLAALQRVVKQLTKMASVTR